MNNNARACRDMHNYTQSYTYINGKYTDIHRPAQTCTDMHWHAHTCTGMPGVHIHTQADTCAHTHMTSNAREHETRNKHIHTNTDAYTTTHMYSRLYRHTYTHRGQCATNPQPCNTTTKQSHRKRQPGHIHIINLISNGSKQQPYTPGNETT